MGPKRNVDFRTVLRGWSILKGEQQQQQQEKLFARGVPKYFASGIVCNFVVLGGTAMTFSIIRWPDGNEMSFVQDISCFHTPKSQPLHYFIVKTILLLLKLSLRWWQ